MTEIYYKKKSAKTEGEGYLSGYFSARRETAGLLSASFLTVSFPRALVVTEVIC